MWYLKVDDAVATPAKVSELLGEHLPDDRSVHITVVTFTEDADDVGEDFLTNGLDLEAVVTLGILKTADVDQVEVVTVETGFLVRSMLIGSDVHNVVFDIRV